MNNIFCNDIDLILDKIRLNCIVLSKEHKKRYLYLKNILKYYRISVIIISSLNSVIAVSTQPFLNQQYISLSNCLLALMCSMIGSIELYLGINSQMENELISSKEFYILSCDIFKMLNLSKDNRNINPKSFLDDCYGRYIKLIENSCVVMKKIEDKLTTFPKELDSIKSSLDSLNELDKISNNSIENNII